MVGQLIFFIVCLVMFLRRGEGRPTARPSASRFDSSSLGSASHMADIEAADEGHDGVQAIDDPFGCYAPPDAVPFHVDGRGAGDPLKLHRAAPPPDDHMRFAVFIGWYTRCAVVPHLRGRASSFYKFQHQAGGYSCGQLTFVVRPLVVNDAFRSWAADLVSSYWMHNGGWFHDLNLDISDEDEYRSRLFGYGLTTTLDDTQPLMESVYPFDATQENLDRMLVEKASIVDLVGPERTETAAIFVVSDNSD